MCLCTLYYVYVFKIAREDVAAKRKNICGKTYPSDYDFASLKNEGKIKVLMGPN